jgi:hypothetical protein
VKHINRVRFPGEPIAFFLSNLPLTRGSALIQNRLDVFRQCEFHVRLRLLEAGCVNSNARVLSASVPAVTPSQNLYSIRKHGVTLSVTAWFVIDTSQPHCEHNSGRELLFNVEVNVRRCTVLDNVLAVQFHFQSCDPRPLQAAYCFSGLYDGVFRSLREALFGGSDNLNHFLSHSVSPH